MEAVRACIEDMKVKLDESKSRVVSHSVDQSNDIANQCPDVSGHVSHVFLVPHPLHTHTPSAPPELLQGPRKGMSLCLSICSYACMYVCM